MAQWIQYDSVNKLLTRSINNGSSFSNLELDASQISQGSFHEDRIPNLNASKITAGTISTARLGSGTADATTYLRGDQTWQTVTVPLATDYYWPSKYDEQTYNDASNHAFAGAVSDKSGLIRINANGVAVTWIPYFANGGSGVAFRWTYLDPDTGWVNNSNGTFSFTDASGLNTYTIGFIGGNGNFEIQRTAGSTAYTVTIFRHA